MRLGRTKSSYCKGDSAALDQRGCLDNGLVFDLVTFLFEYATKVFGKIDSEVGLVDDFLKIFFLCLQASNNLEERIVISKTPNLNHHKLGHY